MKISRNSNCRNRNSNKRTAKYIANNTRDLSANVTGRSHIGAFRYVTEKYMTLDIVYNARNKTGNVSCFTMQHEFHIVTHWIPTLHHRQAKQDRKPQPFNSSSPAVFRKIVVIYLILE
jgi:hypothetical protein